MRVWRPTRSYVAHAGGSPRQPPAGALEGNDTLSQKFGCTNTLQPSGSTLEIDEGALEGQPAQAAEATLVPRR